MGGPPPNSSTKDFVQSAWAVAVAWTSRLYNGGTLNFGTSVSRRCIVMIQLLLFVMLAGFAMGGRVLATVGSEVVAYIGSRLHSTNSIVEILRTGDQELGIDQTRSRQCTGSTRHPK